MVNLNKDQIEKLFNLAGIEFSENVDQNDVSKILIELEKKVITSTYVKSEIAPDNAPYILLVDDLELSIHQLNLLLTKSGFNVCIARSAEEALDQYKKRKFEYVLLDLFLPESDDGLNLLKAINSFEKTRNDNTKTIIISGTDNKDLIHECFQKGADDFIRKSPDWHKDIIKSIKHLETQKICCQHEIMSIIEDQDKKIVDIKLHSFSKELIYTDFEKEVISLVNSGFVNVIVDFQNINEINSKGIGTLISAYKICLKQNGTFKIYNIKPSINETLSYVFLQNVIPVFNNKESVLKSFS